LLGTRLRSQGPNVPAPPYDRGIMKIGADQIWKHNSDSKINLLVLEAVNSYYKVKIIGPRKNMHMIETVSQKYITSHYNFSKKLEKVVK
jgi:hypothetical protein